MYSKKFIFFSFFMAIIAIASAFLFHYRSTSQELYEATKKFNSYTLEGISSIITSDAKKGELIPFFLHQKSAIVFGGTSGIGEAMAIKLSEAGVKNVTIVGRNKKEGERIAREMNRVATVENPNHQFIPADLMLLETAHDLVNKNEQLRNNHQHSLQYVVYCQTKATLQGLTPTPAENIDEKLALNFYSRMYLTKLLVPWMKRSREATKKQFRDIQQLIQPRFFSVLAAGMHDPYPHWKSDTRLSKEHYSSKFAADAGTFYTDLVFDKFAELYGPEIGFVHACPGFVQTQWGTDMPSVIRYAIRGLQFIGGRPANECAEFMFRGLIEHKDTFQQRVQRTGNNRKDEDDNNKNKNKHEVILVDQYGRNDQAKKTALHVDAAIEHVWKDTLNVFEEVEKTFS